MIALGLSEKENVGMYYICFCCTLHIFRNCFKSVSYISIDCFVRGDCFETMCPLGDIDPYIKNWHNKRIITSREITVNDHSY